MSNWYRSGSEASTSPNSVSPTSRIFPTSGSVQPTHPSGRSKSCMFCKSNGEDVKFYQSHNLKDDFGRVSCPVLFRYVCPVCQATGYQAHTIKYCPKRRPESFPDVVPRMADRVHANPPMNYVNRSAPLRPIRGQNTSTPYPPSGLSGVGSRPYFSVPFNGSNAPFNGPNGFRQDRHNAAAVGGWVDMVNHPNQQIWRIRQ